VKEVFVIHGLVEYVLAIIRSTVIDKKFLIFFANILFVKKIYLYFVGKLS